VNAERTSGVHDAFLDPSLVACPHCDLLQRLPALDPGASARCPRCDKELWRRREDSLPRTLALTIAAAVLYVVANSVPMLGLTAVGHQASTSVLSGAQQLWTDDREVVEVWERVEWAEPSAGLGPVADQRAEATP